MYYDPYIYRYPYPYYPNVPTYINVRQPVYWINSNETENIHRINSLHSRYDNGSILLTDYGPKPIVVNINTTTKQNNTYRTALWTGEHLQVTLMSLDVGEDIGLEMHPDVDQFLRIE